MAKRRKRDKEAAMPSAKPMKLAEVVSAHRAQHDQFDIVTTVERAHAKTDFIERAQTKRNMTMLPIDRYHRRGLLDDLQYEAATKMHEAFSLAALDARVIGRYSDMVGQGSIQDHRINQSAAYVAWSNAMDYVGRAGREVLMDVVCLGHECGSEWRMKHLRQVLNILVDYYDL